MTLQVKHLYSETAGNRPPAEQVDVDQLWINMGDATIGTKKSNGQLATYAQLTEAEREAVKVIDEEGHLGIEYNALVAILIDKVNQLERRCAQLEANLQSKATF